MEKSLPLTHEPATDCEGRLQGLNPLWMRLQQPDGYSWWRIDLLVLCLSMVCVVLRSSSERHLLSLGALLVLRISFVNFLLAALCVALWWALISMADLFIRGMGFSIRQLISELLLKVTGCSGVAALAIWVRHPERALALDLMSFWLLALLMMASFRTLYAAAALWILPSLRSDRQVLIVGTGFRALELAKEIKAHPRWHYKLLGFVDNEPLFRGDRFLGSIDDLESLLMKQVVDEVIITLPVKSKYDDIQSAILACERVGVQSGYSMDFFSTRVAKRRSVEERGSSVVLHMVHNDSRLQFKRALDILSATIGLVLLSPLLLLVALAVRLTSKGPIIFRQQRYGLNKRSFQMYKFRSMVVDAEQQQGKYEHLNEAGGPVFKIRADPRITTVGRFIRKTSIDELPQLVNVIRGEMSLVGPRPLPTRDVSRFSEPWLMRRFSVRPGLTGLWQVSGRSDTTFANWIQLDLKYIDTWSLLLDLRILSKTFSAVLKREGAA